jgi:hypothetical protein
MILRFKSIQRALGAVLNIYLTIRHALKAARYSREARNPIEGITTMV